MLLKFCKQPQGLSAAGPNGLFLPKQDLERAPCLAPVPNLISKHGWILPEISASAGNQALGGACQPLNFLTILLASVFIR